MKVPDIKVGISTSIDAFKVYDLLRDNYIMAHGLTHGITEAYEVPRDSEIGSLIGSEVHFNDFTKEEHTILFKMDDTLMLVQKRGNKVTVESYAYTSIECTTGISLYRITFPPAPEPLDEEIKVKFWYLTKDGPQAVSRTIAVPSWEAIKGNYASGTKEGLDSLINDFVPDGGGKIILWHGVPGTGKTYALRALVKQWKKWADISYILDPETLFGSSPGYMAQMVFSPSERYIDDLDDGDEQEKWKILILEDTGELLSDNARERSGQGLSRLLNLADGFIGQGLRVLIIITTNEEIGKLHPAVAREGRCAAAINFTELSPNEGIAWAEENDVRLPKYHMHPWTIADLYAHKNTGKIDVTPKMEKIGFKIYEGAPR